MEPRELQLVQTAAGTPSPPEGSGIDLAVDDTGLRITLPRRITSADAAGTVLAALTAGWIGAGVTVAVAGDDPLPAAGLLLFVLVGLGFAAVAAYMGRALATPRVIEDRGDALHLSRPVRGRPTDPITVRKDRIRSVDRRHEGGASGPVRIHTDTAVYRIGGRLERHELEWLEETVRGLVNGSGARPRQA